MRTESITDNRSESLIGQLLMLDRAIALERVGGDEEILQEIAALFLEDYPRQVEDMTVAIAAQDPKGLEVAAHTLKGAVSNFGADVVTEAAFRLEKMGRSGDMRMAREAFDDLVRHLDTLSQDLHRIAQPA